jgi:hypothetical protein
MMVVAMIIPPLSRKPLVYLPLLGYPQRLSLRVKYDSSGTTRQGITAKSYFHAIDQTRGMCRYLLERIGNLVDGPVVEALRVLPELLQRVTLEQ